MIFSPLKQVFTENKNKTPLHAWDWEAFKQLVEAEGEIFQRKVPSICSSINQEFDSENERNLSWDNSPEQVQLLDDDVDVDEEFQQLIEPNKLFSSSDTENESLTTTTSDEEVFPNIASHSRTVKHFASSIVVRKALNRTEVSAENNEEHATVESNNESPNEEFDNGNLPLRSETTSQARLSYHVPIPETQEHVQLEERQLLHRVLSTRAPLAPEVVPLCPGPLHLGQALEGLQLRNVPNNTLQHGRLRQRRSSRKNIDYSKYNESGEI